MKINPVVKKIAKEATLVIIAAFLKSWYINKINRFIDLGLDKIDKDYENEIKLEELDKLFPDEDEEVRI